MVSKSISLAIYNKGSYTSPIEILLLNKVLSILINILSQFEK